MSLALLLDQAGRVCPPACCVLYGLHAEVAC